MVERSSIPEIASSEYRRRQANARNLVAAGKLTQARAEAEMRAWAAIAVLCDAPGVFEESVARYRRATRLFPEPPQEIQLPEDEARCDLARDLCSPIVWGPILSKARDAAIARATTPETFHRANNLARLARALDVPLTAASCVITLAPLDRKAA